MTTTSKGPDEGSSAKFGEALSGADVRRRAAGGVLVIGVRGVAVRLLGLVGNVLLARLLLSSDYGIVALAATVLVFGSTLADVGIGASLIRRREQPTRQELRSLASIQILFTTGLVVILSAAALPFGRTGQAVVVMSSALPLLALRTPASLLLERRLVYRPLAAVELLETAAFNAWAVGTVYAGWGIWGPASGAWIRTVIGVAAMSIVSPAGLVLPGRLLSSARQLLRFGLQFQAVGLVVNLRPLVINTGVVAIAGTSKLAVWAIAERFLAVPVLLFESLWRVLFPMMSRLVQARDTSREALERGLGLLAFAVGSVVVPLVAAAPALIPALLGTGWNASVDALVFGALAFLVSLPVDIVAATYIYAHGRAGAVLGAALAESAIWIVGGLTLLPLLGASAIGLAAIPARLVGAVILVRPFHALVGVRVLESVVRPTVAAILACGFGWALSKSLDHSVPVAVGIASVAFTAYVGFTATIDRDLIRRALVVGRFSVQAARRPTSARPA